MAVGIQEILKGVAGILVDMEFVPLAEPGQFGIDRAVYLRYLAAQLGQLGIAVAEFRAQPGMVHTQLRLLRAERRAIDEPIVSLAREIEEKSGKRRIAVLIPEMVKLRWYQYLLHTDRARQLRFRLLRCGDPRLLVIDVPWYLNDPEDEAA